MISKESVPKVYVKNVTLKTTNNIMRAANNPHVQDSSMVDRIKDRFGKTRLESLGGILERQTSATNQALRVELELEVQDVFNFIDNKFDIFEEEDVLPHLKIRVIQVRDKKVMSYFMNNNNILTTPKIKEASNISDVVSYKELSFKEGEVERGEGEISYIKFMATMESNIDVENLFYIVFSFIDVEGLAQGADFRSQMTIENVIEDGSLNSVGYRFRDSSNRLWTGPVTYDGQSFFKGDTSESLNAEIFRKNSIVDLRDVNRLRNLDLDVSDIVEQLNKEIEEKFPKDARPRGLDANVSELFSTIDVDGSVRAAFQINHHSIIKRNGRFPFVMQTKNANRITKIYELSPIKSLKISRVRVKDAASYNNLGVRMKTGQYFEDHKIPTKIVDMGENSWLGMRGRKFQESDSKTSKVISFSREVYSNNETIRFFTFIDEDFKDITYGKYNYLLELSIQDGTILFIKQSLEKFNEIKLRLQEYENIASNPKNYSSSQNKFTPNLMSFYRERGQEPWADLVEDFITEVKFLVDGVDETRLLVLEHLISPATGNLEGISIFEKVLSSLVSKLANMTSDYYDFYSYDSSKGLSPSKDKRNRDNINMEILFRANVDADEFDNKEGIDFINYLENNEMAINDGQNGLLTLTREDLEERANKETLKYFDQTDINFSIASGHKNYLPNASTKSTKYAFFSPSIIKFRESNMISSLDDGANNWSPDKYNDIEVRSFVKNKSIRDLNAKVTTERDKDLKKINDDFVDQREKATFSEIFGAGTELARTKIASDNSEEPTKDLSSKLFSKEEIMEKNKKTLGALSTQGVVNNFNGFVPSSEEFNFDLSTTDNVLDVNSLTREEIEEETPNQLKALLAGTSNLDSVRETPFVINSNGNKVFRPPDDANASTFINNFLNLVVVEAMVNWKITPDGDFIMKSPEWVKLTEEVISNSRGEILCRVRRFKNKLSNSKSNLDFMNIFNSYFILDTGTSFEVREIDVKPPIQIPRGERKMEAKYLNTGVFRKNG